MTNYREENVKLRGLLAYGRDPCIYCGLPVTDIARCYYGFPGCARADDMLCTPELEQWVNESIKRREQMG